MGAEPHVAVTVSGAANVEPTRATWPPLWIARLAEQEAAPRASLVRVAVVLTPSTVAVTFQVPVVPLATTVAVSAPVEVTVPDAPELGAVQVTGAVSGFPSQVTEAVIGEAKAWSITADCPPPPVMVMTGVSGGQVVGGSLVRVAVVLTPSTVAVTFQVPVVPLATTVAVSAPVEVTVPDAPEVGAVQVTGAVSGFPSQVTEAVSGWAKAWSITADCPPPPVMAMTGVSGGQVVGGTVPVISLPVRSTTTHCVVEHDTDCGPLPDKPVSMGTGAPQLAPL